MKAYRQEMINSLIKKSIQNILYEQRNTISLYKKQTDCRIVPINIIKIGSNTKGNVITVHYTSSYGPVIGDQFLKSVRRRILYRLHECIRILRMPEIRFVYDTAYDNILNELITSIIDTQSPQNIDEHNSSR